jgi:DNA-binding transcriptional MocR family regulator
MTAKYQQLAQTMCSEIGQGKLAAGQRLPSIRRFALAHDISITTALKTYEQLEAMGLVQASPKSGFFVRSSAGAMREPAMTQFDPAGSDIDNLGLIAAVRNAAQQPGQIPLGTVMLSSALLPLDSLRQSLVRTARQVPLAAAGYGSALGEAALRTALCRHFAEDGLLLSPEALLITNGCMPALSLALLATTSPGDTVAVPAPCYSGHLQLLASLGRKVLEIPCDAHGLDLARLESCLARGECRVALITLTHHNPLGFTLDAADKQRLLAIAERYSCTLIEDDVFGECSHGGPRPLPLKAWDQAGRVVWCGSFSKTLAPGYRIGWCAPGRHLEAMQGLQLAGMLSVNSPLQLALADFVHRGAYRRHLRRLQPLLAAQVDSLRRSVERHFPLGTMASRPQGGYALWLQLPDQIDTMPLYHAAQAAGISMVPGAVFSARGLFRNCLRLNGGNPWSDQLDQAVKWLGQWVIG